MKYPYGLQQGFIHKAVNISVNGPSLGSVRLEFSIRDFRIRMGISGLLGALVRTM